MLALSLQYGFGIMEEFLQGGKMMDDHFASAPPLQNLPMIIGLLAVWLCNLAVLSSSHSVRCAHPTAGYGEQRQARDDGWD